MVSILPLNELKEKTLGMSAFFETSTKYPESYGTTSGNHDGQGVSHGVLQYNFGTGSLNTLWRFLINTYPDVCQSAFKGDTARYNQWVSVVQDTNTSNQIAFGESISEPTNKHLVVEPWRGYFMTLGTTRESIDKQVSMSDSWRVNADNWFNAMTQLWSRKAYFLLWDISVQMGRFNPLSEVQAEFGNPANTSGMTEDQAEQWRCDRIAWHSAYNNAVSAANQAGVFKRKDMIAKETGDWWGTPYNGVTYDAVLEPAFVGERSYSYPVITTLTDNNPRVNNTMSSVTGYNQTVITVAFDQAITKYSVNRGGTDHLTGTVLESGDVSYSAGQTFTVTVDNTELVVGDNIIYIYGMNDSEQWSDGLVEVPPEAPEPKIWTYIGKVTGSTVVNPNSVRYEATTLALPRAPTGGTEFTQAEYDGIMWYSAAVTYTTKSNGTKNNRQFLYFSFDTTGVNVSSDNSIEFCFRGYLNAGGRNLTFAIWNPGTSQYDQSQSATPSNISSLFVTFENINLNNYITNNKLYVVVYTEVQNTGTYSILLDYVIMRTFNTNTLTLPSPPQNILDDMEDAVSPIVYIGDWERTIQRAASGTKSLGSHPNVPQAAQASYLRARIKIPAGVGNPKFSCKYMTSSAATQSLQIVVNGTLQVTKNGQDSVFTQSPQYNLNVGAENQVLFIFTRTGTASAGDNRAYIDDVNVVYDKLKSWRYVRFQGFGDNTSTTTTRLVELQAIEAGTGTNLLYQKTPISGEAVSTGGTIAVVTNNVTAMTPSSEIAIWWVANGVPTLTYDLLALKNLDTIKLWMYSVAGDLRQTRFKLSVSQDNVSYTTVADYSANTNTQDPTAGWTFTAPNNP